MSETIEVKPMPIQRNRFDVAIELTQLHIYNCGLGENGIAGLFAKYYTLVQTLEAKAYEGVNLLSEFLPQEIVDKMK